VKVCDDSSYPGTGSNKDCVWNFGKKAYNNIPIMNHPLSRSTDQPTREEIVFDGAFAYMSWEVFKRLSVYECSIPTGAWPGKIWRNRDYLCWFSESVEEGYLDIHRKLIFVLDNIY
jgi:hypothetical protein